MKSKLFLFFFIFNIYANIHACGFPSIYIHHYAFPVKTDVDNGPSTWYNPMISGQYDGCYLGVSDVHNFTLSAYQTHTVELFKYYAVLGNSKHTCNNYNIYGDDSPVTKRYEALCNDSSDNPPTAPGICLVYEDALISWAFSDCVNSADFSSLLKCMDNPGSCGSGEIPNLDRCIGAAGGLITCYPYPLPPSPAPFCDNTNIPPQQPAYLAICDSNHSIASICGDPTSSSNYSTYSMPCARATFNNFIETKTLPTTTPRLIPTTQNGSYYVSLLDNPPSIPVPSNNPLGISSNTVKAISNTGYVEAIYTIQSQQGDNTGPQTRFSSDPSLSLSFYGYNFAALNDICYDFSNNTSYSGNLLDNYGNVRTFRTCIPAKCTGTDPTTNAPTPQGCEPQNSQNSYCIEEITGLSPSSNTCFTTTPTCFSRPEPSAPAVTFCPANNGVTNQHNYCLQATFNNSTYTFSANSAKTQGIFTAIETDNNFNIPNTGSACYPYYDQEDNTYGTPNKTKSACQYYAGLSYNNNAYQSGVTKFCLTGYTSSTTQNIVCSSSDNIQINDRVLPTADTISPLDNTQCCSPSENQTTTTCPAGPSGSITRVKNPLELGLCVDVMPYEFVSSCTFTSSTLTPQQLQQLNADCSNYITFCSTINNTNNGYLNADICNKNFIDCSINSKITPNNQPSDIQSNVCQFYNLNN